ncbi:recombinase family protein [Clostridium thermosuccinogenes]|uniref:recombinase family protein n=1 Tax=Clostridium thermosuccinogenes TaxID=84032 RepID=UPI001FA81C3B|nr:recombinase family protein [Pseudoclostridium thermosuccinogenes]
MPKISSVSRCEDMLREEKRHDYKIGIYVRESRDENEENYETIETQRDLLLDFVSKSNLGKVFRVYIDDNVSGSAFEREGLQAMREDVVQGYIDLLIVKDLSRLGRNNAKTLLLLDFLEEYGVRVITFDGRYDSARDNDTVGIDTWYNERYVRDISRKIRANIRFKIQKGEYLGNAPFGYKKSELEKNKLCVDETTAFIVREIYALYREGYGYKYIADILNSKGYPSPSSKKDGAHSRSGWNAVAVQRILGNRVYVGDTVQGISEKISFKSKKTRRLPPSRWVITKNTHEAIISREEFEEVQRIRKEKSINSGSHKGTLHVFKGILYCGRCGSVLFARVRKNRPTGYICSNYAKNGKKACTSHHVNEMELCGILMKELEMILSDGDIRKRVAEKLDEFTFKSNDTTSQIERLEESLAVKQKQQDTLYMDKLEGKITEQMFLRLNASIERKISQISDEIERLKKIQDKTQKGAELIREALDEWKNDSLTNEMIKLLVERIVVFDPEDDMAEAITVNMDKNINTDNGVIVIYFNYG